MQTPTETVFRTSLGFDGERDATSLYFEKGHCVTWNEDYPPGNDHISHQTGKGTSASKSHFWGDMLVPWRVLSSVFFFSRSGSMEKSRESKGIIGLKQTIRQADPTFLQSIWDDIMLICVDFNHACRLVEREIDVCKLQTWVHFLNCCFNGFIISMLRSHTTPKFNIAPQKWWLEDYFPIGKVAFQGLC